MCECHATWEMVGNSAYLTTKLQKSSHMTKKYSKSFDLCRIFCNFANDFGYVECLDHPVRG